MFNIFYKYLANIWLRKLSQDIWLRIFPQIFNLGYGLRIFALGYGLRIFGSGNWLRKFSQDIFSGLVSGHNLRIFGLGYLPDGPGHPQGCLDLRAEERRLSAHKKQTKPYFLWM